MKKSVSVLTLVIVSVFTFVASATAFPPTRKIFSPKQQKAIVAELSEQLPMEVGNGMTWTAVDFTDQGRTMQVTIKLGETVGDDLSVYDFVKVLKEMTNDEFAESFDKEFAEIRKEFDVAATFIFVLPDGTRVEKKSAGVFASAQTANSRAEAMQKLRLAKRHIVTGNVSEVFGVLSDLWQESMPEDIRSEALYLSATLAEYGIGRECNQPNASESYFEAAELGNDKAKKALKRIDQNGFAEPTEANRKAILSQIKSELNRETF